MNLGIESETLEFKKTTGEIEKAVDNIASMRKQCMILLRQS